MLRQQKALENIHSRALYLYFSALWEQPPLQPEQEPPQLQLSPHPQPPLKLRIDKTTKPAIAAIQIVLPINAVISILLI